LALLSRSPAAEVQKSASSFSAVRPVIASPARPNPPAAATAARLPPTAAELAQAGTPSVRRRLAAFLYEGVLLFGVVTIAGLLFSVLTNQRHALQGATAMQAFLFALLGLYFAWFWTRSGQTLAMQTWHVRLVMQDGSRLRWGRALARYVLCWLWFVPALLVLYGSGLQGGWPASGALITGVLTYALLARLHPDRQFWHDAICGTRLVTWRPPPRKR
jgi:uncharacterized RDD family membrane protein YckC